MQACRPWGVPGVPHTVADRRILFKKSLMVLKDPYGSPEVPYTPESQNPMLKILQKPLDISYEFEYF